MGGVLGQIWCAQQALGAEDRTVEVICTSYLVLSTTSHLRLGICKDSGTFGKNGKDPEEWCFGDCREARSGILQLSVPCAESDGRMVANY